MRKKNRTRARRRDASAPPARPFAGPSKQAWRVIVFAVLAVALIAGAWILRPHTQPGSAHPVASVRPTPAPTPQFADESQCSACHAGQAQRWRGSHHDLAMQVADDTTVLGNFENASFAKDGVRTRFFRRDGKFWINTDGEDGRAADFEVKYAFGVAPLQQYLVQLDRGRLQAFTVAWDVARRRWFDLYPHEHIDHQDELHWTRPAQNWNFMCAECHSTDLKKNYDAATRTYRTTWHQIDVGCQACHGPADTHGRASAGAASAPHTRMPADPMTGTASAQIETCARCHSRRAVIWGDHRHGGRLMDTHLPALLDANLYYADGQIEGEVYEYGSFLQSKMYQHGLRCSDCHDPHSLELRRPGNELCAGCHNATTPSARAAIDVSGLRHKNYDSREHHFHAPGQPGSQCVDCHAPSRTYMEIDPRRDHSFRIPRPDLSVQLGTPNACNSCHEKRSAQWAADTIAKWYGPEHRREPTWATALWAGRQRSADAPSQLIALGRDAHAPAIVRATALEMLGAWPGQSALETLRTTTNDADPLVRLATVSALEGYPVEQRGVLADLLADPVRAVRTSAVVALAPLAQQLTAVQRYKLDAAIAEFEASQRESADQPSSWMNLGNLYASLGAAPRAEQAYQEAIRVDPAFVPAYVNLADLKSRTGENGGALDLLRTALERAPNDATLHHSVGLALIRERRYEEAIKELGTAARLAPADTRFAYVLGVALHDTGQPKQGMAVLEQALARSPADVNLLSALAAYARESGDEAAARKYSERLQSLQSSAAPSSG